jgi:hypothetical protein
MAVKYDYKNLDDFIKDRARDTHIGLKAAVNNEVLFGQIIRNVMKHAFRCGVVHASCGEVVNDNCADYE